MAFESLNLQKRAEDIKEASKYLKSLGLAIHENFQKNKNYYSSLWLIIGDDISDAEMRKKFKEKSENFFKRNLSKLGIDNYIICFVKNKVLIKFLENIFSALLLISPAGSFLFFSSAAKAIELPEKVGKAKIFYFNDILEVLKKEEQKKLLQDILANFTKSKE